MEGRITKQPWNSLIKLMFLDGLLYAKTDPGVHTFLVGSVWSVARWSGINSESFLQWDSD